MTNAYPRLPVLAYARTTVPMSDVISYLRSLDVPVAVRRIAYVVFRNESANGTSGINNNFGGVQADSGLWPAKYDDLFSGTVTIAENKTGRPRIFLAFKSWQDCVSMLASRLQDRGLFMGGHCTVIVDMQIHAEVDLALAYYRSWVVGRIDAPLPANVLAEFESMYGQAIALFRDDQAAPSSPTAAAPAPTQVAPSDADALMAQEQAGRTFPTQENQS